ncbi:MAG: histidine phosphatase family protein, partial [Clostridiales bacterium]|nr:histidine phosphatase family protein [Clostridiales bacterium]
MRILIIRHSDPDYKLDSLTPRGFKEAEALGNWLGQRRIDYIYASPLGRAQ